MYDTLIERPLTQSQRRCMQLSWLYFCGICLKVWPNATFLGCNHQSSSIPSYSLYVQLLWHPMYYPGGTKARVSHVQWSDPHSIFTPTQDSHPGGRIQNHKQWPLHYYCKMDIDGPEWGNITWIMDMVWMWVVIIYICIQGGIWGQKQLGTTIGGNNPPSPYICHPDYRPRVTGVGL